MSLNTGGGAAIGAGVETEGGGFVGRDGIEATIDGANVTTGINNKQVTTTTTTTIKEAPRAETVNTFYLPTSPQPLPATNDTIILYLMQQNNVLIKLDAGLTGLDNKLENQVSALTNRLRELEEKIAAQNIVTNNRMSGWETANNATTIALDTLNSRLRLLSDSNIELEHMSKRRGLQADEMEVKMREFTAMLEKLAKDFAKMPTKGIDPRALGYALLLVLAFGVSFMLGLGFYFMGWRL